LALCALLSGAIVLPAAADGHPPLLRVYGPGGPHKALTECAALYQHRSGQPVAVIKGSPEVLARKVREDGDLYYAGAPYMLEQFARRNPGVLNLASLQRLAPRRIGILVRTGNPRRIRELRDLQRSGVTVLEARLEDMTDICAAGRTRPNYTHHVYTGLDGVDAWRNHPEIDAWLTYKSWHALLDEEADFVELPGDLALRFTPIAATSTTRQREAAERFVAFLRSDEARRIFREHGWE
jgi:accessory colonization factor AcfC